MLKDAGLASMSADNIGCYQPVMPNIEFNWPAFIDTCSVPYCDITEAPSLAYKTFVAFSQVGGILTSVLFVLRVIIWPILTWLLLPKAAQSTCASKQDFVVNAPEAVDNGRVQLVPARQLDSASSSEP